MRQILREIGPLPNPKAYQWLFRTSRLNNQEKGIFIINCGVGPSIEDIVMPYFIILITVEAAFLGDSPTTIYQKINACLME